MFNKKIKQHVNYLEGKIYEMEKDIMELRNRTNSLQLQLERPPIYKLGDTNKCFGECFMINPVYDRYTNKILYEYHFRKDGINTIIK